MLTAWGRWREDCLQMRIFVALPSPSRLTDFTVIRLRPRTDPNIVGDIQLCDT